MALVGVSAVGFFAQGWRAAARAEAQASYVAVLGGSIVAALLGVASIVIGVRGDAPGLALLGIAVIFADLVGVLAVALRTAQRGA